MLPRIAAVTAAGGAIVVPPFYDSSVLGHLTKAVGWGRKEKPATSLVVFAVPGSGTTMGPTLPYNHSTSAGFARCVHGVLSIFKAKVVFCCCCFVLWMERRC